MTDKEYEKEKTRIKKFVIKWAPVFELSQWNMLFYYNRWYNEDNINTKAVTRGRWQYRHATIEFFLPMTVDCDDYELERTVIHEFMHVILMPMAQNLIEGCQDEHEYTTVSLQRVAARAYTMGLRKKNKKSPLG